MVLDDLNGSKKERDLEDGGVSVSIRSRGTQRDNCGLDFVSDSRAVLRSVQTAALRVISTSSDSCQSLLDEALLSTLPPSNMAQSESLYTQAAAAAASTSLDHQDTADPLSTRTPGCSLTLTEIITI